MPQVTHDTREKAIRAYYHTLFGAWGPQYWWPARSSFEVIAGAFLTQNTAWTNVERALENLRNAGSLSAAGIRRLPLPELEQMIRPSGYFRQKARRLKSFVAFLDRRHDGSLRRMLLQPTNKLREELLGLEGIGPETADSILLYAGNHSVFVVDAYTRRILLRHRIISDKTSYEEIRQLVEHALVSPPGERSLKGGSETRATMRSPFPGVAHTPSPTSETARTELAQRYNEMHGLIVGVGKHYCKKTRPRCEKCPLRSFLPEVPLAT